MDRVVEVVLALLYMGCLMLWASYRPKRRDSVDDLLDRRRDQIRPSTRDT